MTDVSIRKVNEVYLHLNAAPHILQEIHDDFSFEVEGAKFSPAYRKKYWNGRIYLLNLAKQTIPAGLVYRLCKWFDRRGYSWQFANNEFYGAPYEIDEMISHKGIEVFMNSISRISPRDYQVNAIYHSLKEYRKTIVSPTASGKSLILYGIARYLKSIGKRTLIIVPTKSLVEQLYSDFEDYGWNVKENVFRIYQGKGIQTDAPVVISTWQSIFGLDKSWFRQFSGVIVDEVHLAKAKSLQDIMKKCQDAKWRIGTTGTLTGKNVHQFMIEGMFGPVFTTAKASELIEQGHLSKLKVKIYLLKHLPQSFSDYQEEIEYLIDHQPRNHFIMSLANSLKGNVLILFTRVEGHGIPLAEMMMTHTDRPVHILHGGIDVDTREDVRKICESSSDNVILGSYGVASTGINIRNLSHVIFASPSKSKVRTLQSIGRSLRKAKGKKLAMIHDLADDTRKTNGRNNYTLNHLAERIKYYIDEEFAYSIDELELTEPSSVSK